MTALECMALAYLKWTGKTMTFAFTDPKGIKLLALMNLYQDEWSREQGIDWISLYDPLYPIGTVTATDTFDLDLTSIRKVSQQEGDSVRIPWPSNPTSSWTDYEMLPADRLREYNTGRYCARQGSYLKFNRAFKSTDPEYGGTIYVPVFYYADVIVNPTDAIQVDNPNWLAQRSAAEAIRTDITRVAQYPNALTEANAMMQRMKDDNLDDQNTDVTAIWNPSPWNPAGVDRWKN